MQGIVQLRAGGQSVNAERLQQMRQQNTRERLERGLDAEKRAEFVEVLADGIRAEARIDEIHAALVAATDEMTAPEAMGLLLSEAQALVGKQSREFGRRVAQAQERAATKSKR